MYKNIYDSHTHSVNSHDGESTVKDMCLYAIENGIKGFALSDHCEVDLYSDKQIQSWVQSSFDDMEKAKEEFGDRLLLSSSIELGQPLFDIETSTNIVSKNNYDFILGSMHSVCGMSDFCMYNYKEWTMDEIYTQLEKYYSEMFEVIKWGRFDSFAHITYPLRYIEGIHGIKVDIDKFDDIIDTILKTLAQNGKAIEMNTSGLRQQLKKPMPTIDYIERYKNYGGEMVTIGSDAHRCTDMAKDFDTAFEMLKSIGFKHYAFFNKRKPIMNEIK